MNSRLADRYQAAAGVASAIGAYAKSRGIDAAPIARACGLDPDRFEINGERVGLDRLCRFMEALALVSGDDLFGLKSAEAFAKGGSGPFGYALLHAPTVRDGLVFMGRNLQKVSETSICTLEIGAREAIFEWTYSPLIVHRQQYVDMTAAQALAHLKAFLGTDIHKCRLELERKKPLNTGMHKQILTRNTSFGASINRFTLPAIYLDRTNPAADPKLFTILAQQVESIPLRNLQSADPVTSIKLHVADTLASETISLTREAERLGMSPRTLQRRLTEAGTSLQAIMDECRKEMAESLLMETELSLSEISYRLGFSAPAAFTRSAIRWFGLTPSAYRRQHRNQS
jgi:AraC-like DNA-binding protein